MAEYQVSKYSHRYDKDIDMLCNAFSHESLAEFGMEVNIEKMWRDIADKCQEHSFLLITEGRAVGLICGYLTTSMTNEKLVVQEVMWYVYPEHRKYGLVLLKYFEAHARSLKATSIIMALMHNSKSAQLGRIYERKGYKPFETHYMKELDDATTGT